MERALSHHQQIGGITCGLRDVVENATDGAAGLVLTGITLIRRGKRNDDLT